MRQAIVNTAKKLEEILNLRPSPIIGLDIDSGAVRMVGLHKNGDGYRVTAAAVSTIKSALGSEYNTQSDIIAAIEECLKSSMGNIARNSCFVAGLSGPKVKVSNFNFPSLRLDEVERAVMLEASQICPFDIQTSVVDYQLIGIDKADLSSFKKKRKIYSNVHGVLAIAAKEEISKKLKLTEDALLKCVLMDSDGLALLNCLKEYLTDDEKLPIAVINIGMSLTTVAILGADGSPFIRDLKCCGSDIIDHIAMDRGVGSDQVSREISEDTGSSDFSANIAPACKGLIRDINETLAYYLAHQGGNAVTGVYVCGGFSLYDDCVKALVGGINSKVSVWNPFLRMNYDNNIAGSDLVGKCGPALALAAGLAMRQV